MSYKCWVSRTSVAEVWVPNSVGLFEKKKKNQCLSAFFVLGTSPLFHVNTRKQEYFVAKIIKEASLSCSLLVV